MIIPAAEDIEMALDALQKVNPRWLQDQDKELDSALGAAAAKSLGVDFPASAEFRRGYALGLQTARMVIAGNVEVLTHKANPESIL